MKNRFIVKGINDEESTCECCGREGLKRVVWIEDTETSEIRHFGVVCATAPAKAFGLKKEIQAAVRAFDKAIAEKARSERNAAWANLGDECAKMRDALYNAAMGGYYLFTFSNGHVARLPENKELMSACHDLAFSELHAK